MGSAPAPPYIGKDGKVSFCCLYGHRIHDEPEGLSYYGHVLPDRQCTLFSEIIPRASASYIKARIEGEDQEWQARFFADDYARLKLEDEFVIYDVRGR